MVLVVCERGSEGKGGEGRRAGSGGVREQGWDKVDERGRKKKHVEIVAVTYCEKDRKKKGKKSKANSIKQLLKHYEAMFKFSCIFSVVKCSNDPL